MTVPAPDPEHRPDYSNQPGSPAGATGWGDDRDRATKIRLGGCLLGLFVLLTLTALVVGPYHYSQQITLLEAQLRESRDNQAATSHHAPIRLQLTGQTIRLTAPEPLTIQLVPGEAGGEDAGTTDTTFAVKSGDQIEIRRRSDEVRLRIAPSPTADPRFDLALLREPTIAGAPFPLPGGEDGPREWYASAPFDVLVRWKAGADNPARAARLRIRPTAEPATTDSVAPTLAIDWTTAAASPTEESE